MFSTNIKRSVATLGVVAGLLAAAVPASAQMVDGPVLAKAKAGINSEVEPVELRAASRGDSSLGNPVTLDVVSSEVFELNTFGGDDTLSAQGTQVGSEGVKAPSTEQVFDHTPMDEVVFSATSNRTGPREGGIIWNNGDGNDMSKAEGTQVGSEGVKAPTRADDQVKVSGYTFNPKEVTIA